MPVSQGDALMCVVQLKVLIDKRKSYGVMDQICSNEKNWFFAWEKKPLLGQYVFSGTDSCHGVTSRVRPALSLIQAGTHALKLLEERQNTSKSLFSIKNQVPCKKNKGVPLLKKIIFFSFCPSIARCISRHSTLTEWSNICQSSTSKLRILTWAFAFGHLDDKLHARSTGKFFLSAFYFWQNCVESKRT